MVNGGTGGATGNQMMDFMMVNALMNNKDGNGLWSFIWLQVITLASKYGPQMLSAVWTFFCAWILTQWNKRFQGKIDKALGSVVQETENEIQFSRMYDNKKGSRGMDANERTDAILYHIGKLPVAKKMLYIDGIHIVNNKVEFEIGEGVTFKLEKLEFSADHELSHIEFRLFSKKISVVELRTFVDKLLKQYLIDKRNRLGDDLYFFDHHVPLERPKIGMMADSSSIEEPASFTKNLFVTNRTLYNVFFEQREEVLNRVKFFMERKDWYDSKGIPYTLGFMLYGSPGCFAPDTGVLMFDGTTKKVQDIVMGDIVMGDDSTPRNVVKLMNGLDNMYKIIPIKGDPIIVNENHTLVLKKSGYNKTIEISVKNFLQESPSWRERHKWFRYIPNQMKNLKKAANCQLICGFKIEPIGVGEYYGFTLDGNHRFLLDDFSVVRNCGKTSAVKAIANMTHRHVINVNLGKIKTKSQLKELFYSDRIEVLENSEVGANKQSYIIPINQRLYVIEDIDCLSGDVLKKRNEKDEDDENKEKNEGEDHDSYFSRSMGGPMPSDSGWGGADIGSAYTSSTSISSLKQQGGQPTVGNKKEKKEEEIGDLDLSSILNVMDGTLETPGRIIIITSNYPEKLDHAFIRPGRIDMIIEFKKASRQIVSEMFQSFYDKETPQQDLENIDDYKWTPAEVGQILFKHFHDPEQSLKDLAEFDPKEYFKFSYFDNEDETSDVEDNQEQVCENVDVNHDICKSNKTEDEIIIEKEQANDDESGEIKISKEDNINI